MILLSEEDKREFRTQSSKGNQLKWFKNGTWFKADYTGYEALAEYMISHLLIKSTLAADEYVIYDLEKALYKRTEYDCCCSNNFLPEGWQIITLERLYKNVKGQDLTKLMIGIKNHEERLSFLVKQIEQITSIRDFGIYMNKLLTIDALFLNEDRHLHNIAVLLDTSGKYHLCPIFDNGAALLADTTMDYPLTGNIYEMMAEVRTKTICSDPLEQLEISEKLYGYNLKFYFSRKDVIDLLENATQYSDEIRNRVKLVLLEQIRRFKYMF